MWLAPSVDKVDELYIAYRNKQGMIEDVNLQLKHFIKEENPMLNFDDVSLPTVPDLEAYAHEVSIDAKQMQIFDALQKERFVKEALQIYRDQGYTKIEPTQPWINKAVALLHEATQMYTDPHKDCTLYNTKHRSRKMGEKQEEIKRFTAKKKADIVMDIFQGKTTVAEVSRKYDLTPALIEEWMEEARKGMENQLRARPKDIAALYEDKIKEMKAVIGELTLENMALKKYDALFGDEKK